MFLKKNFIIISAVFLLKISVHAQIYSVGADAVRRTEYSINRVHDSIYVFNASDCKGNFNNCYGKLKAISPDSSKQTTFVWKKYDNAIKGWSKTFDSIPSDSMSEIDTLTSGCYQVRIKNKNHDTIFRAWVFINQLKFHLKKDDKGHVPLGNYTCEWLDLGVIRSGDTRYDSTLWYVHNDFNYVNPENRKAQTLTNYIDVKWTTDPAFTVSDTSLQIRIYGAPAENSTLFTLTISDTFHNLCTDTVRYISVNTKADFDVYIQNDSSRKYNKAKTLDTTNIGESPLVTLFKNTSKRRHAAEWIVSDTLQNQDPLDSAHSHKMDSVKYTYYFPHNYKIKLISTSPEGCTDTSYSKIVSVAPSKFGSSQQDTSNKGLVFPNAFCPNCYKSKYGLNNYFIYKSDSFSLDDTYQSIRYFHIWIYSQWGHLVYDHSGSLGSLDYGWHGWDGKINHSDRDAVPGVYYYVYEAVGWGSFKTIKKGGYVYLFRK